jgi:hypothetical protein
LEIRSPGALQWQILALVGARFALEVMENIYPESEKKNE